MAAVVLQNVVDEIIALHDHRRVGAVLAGVALPHQNLVDVLAFFFGGLYRDVRGGLMIHPLTVAPITVGVNQHAAAGIGSAQTASLAAESAENDGMHDAQARAGQHGDGQLGNHGHVNGDAVAGFQSRKVTQKSRGFVHAPVQLLIGDGRGGFTLGLRNKNERGFVLIFGEMAVHAVVAGVELAADKPFPERRMLGVQRGVPVLIPVEQFGVMSETLRKIFFVELRDEVRVVEVGLANEFRGRAVIAFLFPVDGDLRLTDFQFGFMLFCV